MRTTMTATSWAAAAVVGAILVAGCGGGGAVQPGAAAPAVPSAPTPAPTAFGKEGVRADIAAATEAAGLPGETTPLSPTPTAPPTPDPADPPATDKERAREEVVARIAVCSVGWSAADGPGSAQDGAEARKRFRDALAGLVERGWKESRPVEEVPVGKGTMLMAQYKKQEWTLHARHVESGLLDMTTMTATEDACANRFTDAELDLLED
ncbi:hypothetical protein [Streptomyces sp. A0592]|uniref:hypothetical protein n=1 Tax=Streptomyces sp. A0592 TaxID=2563099 RepID=UPI00109EC923|nr:hypothetical protein [Streptomyces sp. A0592]THA80196.1 hypothetical protein E6U81_29860 [Streptomyces sp. A0592]